MNKKYVNSEFPHIVHGADYNPEQWIDSKEIWDEDMRLMKLANCNEMTIGIFSWSHIEPQENHFDFSFLDEIIEKIDKNGGKVILATPSGARPRWLSEKYPEVLRVNELGQKNQFGARHNHCFTSPKYRERVKIINEKLAERYGNHPAVIAWHISNEYGGECHCELCKKAFRNYLKKKFNNDIYLLNKEYWTSFWSHKYDNFEQIDPPSPLGEMSVLGLNLDWHRFVTAQTVDFMKNEIEPLKKHSNKPITTNMQYEFKDLDYYKFVDVMDFASWDAYPKWHSGNDIETAQNCAFWHDYYRSLFKKPFYLMEHAPGQVNWHEINKIKRPKLEVLSSLQAVAHGSDSVQYFQWRKSRGGVEKFHGAVVGHDGTENTRIFNCVKEKGTILKKIDEITGTCTKSEVAIIYEIENYWALKDCQGYNNKDKKYFETCYAYHKYFWQKGINVDIVNSNEDLSKYKLVVAPMLYKTDEKCIENLTKYVKNGGTLYGTYIFGQVNENDLCYLGFSPANQLKDVFGLIIEETDSLYKDDVIKVNMNDKEYFAYDFCDIIKPNGCNVLAKYSNDYYSNTPAFTKNLYYKGKAYFQAFRDDGEFKNDALDDIVKDLKIKTSLNINLPNGVTAHTREDDSFVYTFIENYSDKKCLLNLDCEYYDMINEKLISKIELNNFEFAILKLKNK